MSEFKQGDRVVYSGPVINEMWPVERQGTVLGSRMVELIDIQWDTGAINEGQFAFDFTIVPGGAE
jgi:hypothetical protein